MATSKSSWFGVWMAISVALLLPMLYGAYQVFLVGHTTIAATNQVPWNIFVVAYAFLVSGIGLCYLGSLGIVFNLPKFHLLAKRSLFLSIVIVLAGLIAIMMDIGRPLRAGIYFITSPNFSSPLWWLGSLYGVYLVMLVAEFWTVMKLGHEGIKPKVVAVATFIVAVVVHSSLGSVFGMTYAKPMWFGPYYPIYFILSAMLAAVAIYIPVTLLTYRMTGKKMDNQMQDTIKMLGRLLTYLLLSAAFFLYWKVRASLFAGTPEMNILVSGSWSNSFWLLELGLGFIIPLFILATMRKNSMRALASVLALIGMMAGRYHFIILGQLLPNYQGQVEGMASYVPNGVEIASVIGIFGVIAFCYGLGVKYLAISEDEHEGKVNYSHKAPSHVA